MAPVLFFEFFFEAGHLLGGSQLVNRSRLSEFSGSIIERDSERQIRLSGWAWGFPGWVSRSGRLPLCRWGLIHHESDA